MRIATWNVNSLKARMPRVTQWIEMFKPDVLCMQETKLADDAFPSKEFQKLGYESVHHGEGRWNGVAILSRVGLEDPHTGFADGGEPDQDARIVWVIRYSTLILTMTNNTGNSHSLTWGRKTFLK